MARKLIAISANVFFPTTILNIISFSTNYYKNDYFESIVGINLTSMLVLTALIVQVLGAHMGREHASREKKLPMLNFLIFVQKNVYRIRFQEIKIGSL